MADVSGQLHSRGLAVSDDRDLGARRTALGGQLLVHEACVRISQLGLAGERAFRYDPFDQVALHGCVQTFVAGEV